MEPDQLTPRTLAVARLVFLCVTDSSLGRQARHRLTLLLLGLVSGTGGAASALEPPAAALLSQLRAARLPAAFVEQFTGEMRGAALEPEDVWNLVADLFSLTQPTAEPDAPSGQPPAAPRVERSSVFGLFARRVRVSFEYSSFEQTCTITARLRGWLEGPPEPTQGRGSEAGRGGFGDEGMGSMGGLGASSLPLTFATPSWAHVLPRSQLKCLLHERVIQMEQVRTITIDPFQNLQAPALFGCFREKTRFISVLRGLWGGGRGSGWVGGCVWCLLHERVVQMEPVASGMLYTPAQLSWGSVREARLCRGEGGGRG
jgi:hypothetical protein